MNPLKFIQYLETQGIDFYAGVPDSLLKQLCSCLSAYLPPSAHITAANEGNAMGIAAGYHLATGKTAAVYMQNSGLGNTVNPLLSLHSPDVYQIPTLLLIGWRGEPGIKDEPQHLTQGRLTPALLETMQIPYAILSDDESTAVSQLQEAAKQAQTGVYALIIRKNFFSASPLPKVEKAETSYTLSREEAIATILSTLPENAAIVSTTGMISREVFELRAKAGVGHQRDFLTVGSMGHASQIALGIALAQPDRPVYCLDGDGAAIMHMGGLAIIGQSGVKNLTHIVLNNGAHDSVGGQATVGLMIDFCSIAVSCGYENACSVSTRSQLKEKLSEIRESKEGPYLLEVIVTKGARADLGRPTATPQENKQAFMDFLRPQ